MGESTVEEVTVLHVDDQKDLVDVTATYLERKLPSFTIETATDPQAALGGIGTANPDCIVSDYDMPGKNGL